MGVGPDSKADAAGVKKGDVILEVDRVSVASVKDFRSLLAQRKKSEDLNLLVKRMNAGLMVIHLA